MMGISIALMGRFILGDLWHEILGILLFILWTVHILLNRRWYGSLFKGTYTPSRIFITAVNILLAAAAAGLVLSSTTISNYIFAFLPFGGAAAEGRVLHLFCSHWYFVLMSIHIGLHCAGYAGKNTAAKGPGIHALPSGIMLIIISAYGIYACMKEQILSYLFLRQQFVFFDPSQNVFVFYAEYICICAVFAETGYIVLRFLQRRKTARRG